MSDTLQTAPYRTLILDNGSQVPMYIIPFNAQGQHQAPATYQQMLTTLQNGNYSDVFLFSHGWNTSWPRAIDAYNTFIDGYIHLRRTSGFTYGRPFLPFLVGVSWPSIALASSCDSAPQLAGFSPGEHSVPDSTGAEAIQALAAVLSKDERTHFYALIQQKQDLSASQALELAQLLTPIYQSIHHDLPDNDPPPTPEEIVQIWRASTAQLEPSQNTGNFGFAQEPDTRLKTASIINFLDPEKIIRLATVLEMKDRAGVVGAYGVGPMLVELLNKPNTRVHLIGHSYGCKVVLSAVCSPQLPRPVNSMLLLEPAISYLCFAQSVEKTGKPGGYRTALDRVEEHIITTFSAQDLPLTDFFQLAVRRPEDLGEEKIAGVPPSRHAALGGYGPGGCDADCTVLQMKEVGDPYNFSTLTPKIIALNGSHAIHNHDDISNPFTWWTLFEQIKQ